MLSGEKRVIYLRLIVALFAYVLLLPGGSQSEDLSCSDCSLVVISLDTLRADHLGAYGYHRNTSPTIDRFAEKAILFRNAYSTSCKTGPAHMSLFSSLYPSTHGVLNSNEVFVPSKSRLLAEVLKENGFRTAAFTGCGPLRKETGFNRGFERYDCQDIFYSESIIKFSEWADSLKGKERFFAFLHTFKTHTPYLPAAPFNNMFHTNYQGKIISNEKQLKNMALSGQQKSSSSNIYSLMNEYFWENVNPDSGEDLNYLKALYDGEILELDYVVRKLFSVLETIPQKKIVVVLSDHGEEFYEHRKFKHNQLYQEVLRVPLMISVPSLKGGIKIDQAVSLIDFETTILDLLGLEAKLPFSGQSLRPLIEGREKGRPVYAEWRAPDRPEESEQPEYGAFLEGNKKLITFCDLKTLDQKGVKAANSFDADAYLKVHKAELYDLNEDPGEKIDIFQMDPDGIRLLKSFLEQKKKNLQLRRELLVEERPGKAELRKETLKQLRSLGYIR